MTEPEKPAGSIDPPGIVTPEPADATAASADAPAAGRADGRSSWDRRGRSSSRSWEASPGSSARSRSCPRRPPRLPRPRPSPTRRTTRDSRSLPTAGPVSTGLILYPGAKVPAEGYAPTAQAIAGQGYLVVVVPMPLNFAVFDVGAADRVIAAHPEIARWAIGGHSLGGAMAAQYAADHAAAIAGLALCGAYSAANLSASGLAASSVYGSLDAAAPEDRGPGHPRPSARHDRVRADRGRQPRAVRLVHRPAERSARDDLPGGAAGPHRRGLGLAPCRDRHALTPRRVGPPTPVPMRGPPGRPAPVALLALLREADVAQAELRVLLGLRRARRIEHEVHPGRGLGEGHHLADVRPGWAKTHAQRSIPRAIPPCGGAP